jgi:hypothetical protein
MDIRKNVSTNENEEVENGVIDTSKGQRVRLQELNWKEVKNENKFVSGAKGFGRFIKRNAKPFAVGAIVGIGTFQAVKYRMEHGKSVSQENDNYYIDNNYNEEFEEPESDDNVIDVESNDVSETEE